MSKVAQLAFRITRKERESLNSVAARRGFESASSYIRGLVLKDIISFDDENGTSFSKSWDLILKQ